MARYRLSGSAKADISAVLRRTEELHGNDARIRYRACLTTACAGSQPTLRAARQWIAPNSIPAFAAFTSGTAGTRAARRRSPIQYMHLLSRDTVGRHRDRPGAA